MIRTCLCLVLAVLAGCGRPDHAGIPEEVPRRIISLAPNITETLRDLGLESKLVGVSRFGDTDHSGIPVVSDFMSVNYEAVLSLRPDLVILERSSDDQKARLQSLGIPYLETCSLSLADIRASILEIGRVCNVKEDSEKLIGRMKAQMEARHNALDHRPRTLMVFSDFSDQDQVDQIYAFGAECIHSELLEIAGGDNVVTNNRPSVILSREAVIRLNPELIIELSAGGPTNNWNHLQSIDAVQNHRIHVLAETYTTIPSPGSIVQTLNDISAIIRRNELP